jgi:hypothetical protein
MCQLNFQTAKHKILSEKLRQFYHVFQNQDANWPGRY